MGSTTQGGSRVTVTPEVMAKYEAVIGLEVHAQLQTLTKPFCGCSTSWLSSQLQYLSGVPGIAGRVSGPEPQGARVAFRASLALGCHVQAHSIFARKNYSYPDLPKGYQISQYELPLALGGLAGRRARGATKRIGITRLHMEDDAAKSLHEGFAGFRQLELYRLQPLRHAAGRNRFRA